MGRVNPEKQQIEKTVIRFPIALIFSFHKYRLQLVLNLLNELYLENRDSVIPRWEAHISLSGRREGKWV